MPITKISNFKFLFEQTPDGILIVSDSGLIITANPAAERIFGYKKNELNSLNIDVIIPKHLALQYELIRRPNLNKHTSGVMGNVPNVTGKTKSNNFIRLDVMMTPAELPGKERCVAYIIRSKKQSRALETTFSISEKVFSKIQEAIVVTDPDGYVIAVNPAFEKITEYPDYEIVGKNINILKSDVHVQKFYSEIWRTSIKDGEWHGLVYNKRKSGDVYQSWLSVSPIFDDNKCISHYIGISTDITRMEIGDGVLESLIHYDSLTGIPNRLLLNSRVQKTVERARRDKLKFSVLFMDLNGFKKINDDLGHLVGDEILCRVALVLKNEVRETDTLARYGGDEFVLVLEDIGMDDSCAFAQKIIDKFSSPFPLDSGKEVRIGISIGVSFYPESSEDIRQLIDYADKALYSAKRNGISNFKIFRSSLK